MADPKLVIAGGLNEDAKNFSEALKRRAEKVKGDAAQAEPAPKPKQSDSGY